MKDRTAAVLGSGIVPSNAVQELKRWGAPIPESIPQYSFSDALDHIREAVEGYGGVELKQTDLDVLRQFPEKKMGGRLFYTDAGKTKFTEVEFMVNSLGNYLIPWTEEDISDFMLDEGTYLKPTGQPRVYFMDVTDIYYGDRKLFMSCRPVEEAHG